MMNANDENITFDDEVEQPEVLDAEDIDPRPLPEEIDEDTSELQDDESSTLQHVEMSHLSSASASVAGRDILHITINADTPEQAKGILKNIKEDVRAQKLPPRPPADAALQKRVDYWFQHDLQNEKERYFALALSIFSGLKYSDFRDIFQRVYKRFGAVPSDQRENPPSRFENQDDVLIANVNAEIIKSEDKLEEIIQFQEIEFADAIFHMLREKYRDILLDLLPILRSVVENYRYWEVRSRAASAIYDIGKIGFYRVRSKVFERWAVHKNAYVRASVGYPVIRFIQDEDTSWAVKEMLDDWITKQYGNRTWGFRWSAASTLKQIGTVGDEKTSKWSYDRLTEIAGFDDVRVADAVIHTLVVFSLQDQLMNVLLTLKQWIEEGSAGEDINSAPQIRCVVAILAFLVLSQIHIEVDHVEEDTGTDDGQVFESTNLFDKIRQSESGELWELIVALGVRAFEFKMSKSFFDLIKHWTYHSKDDINLRDTVCSYLVDVYWQVQPLNKEFIYNTLSQWSKNDANEHLSEMANSAKERIRDRMFNDTSSSSRIVWE